MKWSIPEPWWKTARAATPEEAAAFCKKLGTGQCAAICLSHFSLRTSNGKCPEASRVWLSEPAPAKEAR